MIRPLPAFALVLALLMAVSHATLPSEVYWNTVLPKTPMPYAIREFLATGLKDEKTSVSVGNGGVHVNTKPKKKGTNVHVQPGPFSYQYSASDDQLKTDPNVALFFLEKDLHPDTTMNLHFTPTTTGQTFLQRHVAKSFPFSSNKLPQILSHFSIKPNSNFAQIMAMTIKECEEPSVIGESKYCATSLESMVDFATSSLKSRDLLASSTTIAKENTIKQKYTMLNGIHELGKGESNNIVACHAQPFVYAVFLCHKAIKTRVYYVPMIGEDGTKVEAIVVCHLDTAKWNPNHLAFRVLKVKPGSTPICHFLPQDHVVWTIKN